MTQLEQAQMATQFLNAISPILVGVFIFGLLTGVFFFSRLVHSLDRLSLRFRKPKRIKAVRDFKEHGDFEYLYLFKGRYYSLGEYQELQKQVFNHRAAYFKFLKQEKQSFKNKGI
jgi:hypothetical protein